MELSVPATVAALSRSDMALIVNCTDAGQNVEVDGRPLDLSPFEVRWVSRWTLSLRH